MWGPITADCLTVEYVSVFVPAVSRPLFYTDTLSPSPLLLVLSCEIWKLKRELCVINKGIVWCGEWFWSVFYWIGKDFLWNHPRDTERHRKLGRKIRKLWRKEEKKERLGAYLSHRLQMRVNTWKLATTVTDTCTHFTAVGLCSFCISLSSSHTYCKKKETFPSSFDLI